MQDKKNDVAAPEAIATQGASTHSRSWWLYLLACTDGRTYVGITLNVAARFRIHASGKGAKFTRSNPPVAVLGAQQFQDKSAALQAEYALKQLDKTDKRRWAEHWPYAAQATSSVCNAPPGPAPPPPRSRQSR